MIAAAVLGATLLRPGVPVLVTGARSGRRPVTASLQAGVRDGGRDLGLDFYERAGRNIARSYDWDMTKKIHLIVIGDDLHLFMHVHPTLGRDGHFRMLLKLPRAQFVHLYADGVPHGLGRQIFRFDVRPDGTKATSVRRVPPPSVRSHAGPFNLTLDRDTIPVGQAATYTLTITRGGKPAVGLHPYLGAMGHGVLIGTRDLSYMHVHAMDAMMMAMLGTDDCGDAILTMMAPIPPETPVPATVQFYLRAPRPGTYAFWYQFRAGATNYAAPFVLTAR